MRNLIYAINFSADGCCDHTKMGGSEEMLEHYMNLFRDVDLQIFGRKTYELMVPYWPDVAKDPTEDEASIAFAKAFVALNRIVFSRTLKSVEEKNTNIVRANLKDEVLKIETAAGQKDLARRSFSPCTTYRAGARRRISFCGVAGCCRRRKAAG